MKRLKKYFPHPKIELNFVRKGSTRILIQFLEISLGIPRIQGLIIQFGFVEGDTKYVDGEWHVRNFLPNLSVRDYPVTNCISIKPPLHSFLFVKIPFGDKERHKPNLSRAQGPSLIKYCHDLDAALAVCVKIFHAYLARCIFGMCLWRGSVQPSV